VGNSYGQWAARFRVPLSFALGVVYLVFSQPTPVFLAAGAVIALIGLAMRSWAAGCLQKNQSLATGGPYAYTRNPLYFGSLLMGAGFALAGRSWVLGSAFLGLFALVYWPTIRREEMFLLRQFGETYHNYASRVPLLFPVLRGTPGGSSSDFAFRWDYYKKNREYEAGLGYLAGIIFLTLKMKLR
jgi:protein-S-isoprenylcysteine O-methyltransferase Ste14